MLDNSKQLNPTTIQKQHARAAISASTAPVHHTDARRDPVLRRPEPASDDPGMTAAIAAHVMKPTKAIVGAIEITH